MCVRYHINYFGLQSDGILLIHRSQQRGYVSAEMIEAILIVFSWYRRWCGETLLVITIAISILPVTIRIILLVNLPGATVYNITMSGDLIVFNFNLRFSIHIQRSSG